MSKNSWSILFLHWCWGLWSCPPLVLGSRIVNRVVPCFSCYFSQLQLVFVKLCPDFDIKLISLLQGSHQRRRKKFKEFFRRMQFFFLNKGLAPQYLKMFAKFNDHKKFCKNYWQNSIGFYIFLPRFQEFYLCSLEHPNYIHNFPFFFKSFIPSISYFYKNILVFWWIISMWQEMPRLSCSLCSFHFPFALNVD